MNAGAHRVDGEWYPDKRWFTGCRKSYYGFVRKTLKDMEYISLGRKRPLKSNKEIAGTTLSIALNGSPIMGEVVRSMEKIRLAHKERG